MRACAREGAPRCTWEVGTHATPGDLVERLLALGLVDDEPTPLAVGMVLTERAGGVRPDVEVRRATTPEERLAAARIAAIAFGGCPSRAAAARTTDDDNIVYLALVDGEPVARASASFGEHGVSLFGGARRCRRREGAAPIARSSRRAGTTRLARGTPVLVTQASPMSRPILASSRLPRGVRDPHPARQVRVTEQNAA